jgi:predicted TIM-barrel fold metal-dependent hydrolase
VPPFPIIDGQLHEIGPQVSSAGEPEARYETMAEIALAWMDAIGVAHAVLHPIDAAFGHWAAAHAPDRFRLVLQLHALDDASVSALVDTARTEAAVVGVRILCGRTPNDRDGSRARERLEGGEYEPFFAACEQHAIPLFALATGNVASLAAVAEAHPELVLFVDHLGLAQPPSWEPGPLPWQGLDEVIALSRYPRVAVKVCGAPVLAREPFPFHDVWPHLRRLIEAFGAERLMWASDIGRFHGRMGWDPLQGFEHARRDYPGKHTYAESLALFLDTDEIGEPEKELILGGSAERLLRLGFATTR